MKHALEKAFVVVQDIFPNETTEYADVVLPSKALRKKMVLLQIRSAVYREYEKLPV